MKKLFGVTTSMTTPFDERDRVDVAALEAMTDFSIAKGTDCLYPCGTTGEMHLMSCEERELVAETVVRRAAGRVTVFIHTGAMTTEDTIRLAKHAHAIGADGIGVVTPSYFNVHDRAMVQFFVDVAQSVPADFPVYMYGIPQCAANDLSVAVAAEVARQAPNIDRLADAHRLPAGPPLGRRRPRISGQDLELDLRTVAEAGARHVSVYSLTIEPGTPFGRRGYTVDEDLDAASFERTGEVLSAYGLERYEVSNHAAQGEESRHNLVYWRGGCYLGVGPSASAYLPEPGPFGARMKNPPIKGWLVGQPPEIDVLDADDVILERLLTGLRTREGVDVAALRDATRVELAEVAGRWLRDTTTHGLLDLVGGRLVATAQGLQRLDAVMRAFVGSRRSVAELS